MDRYHYSGVLSGAIMAALTVFLALPPRPFRAARPAVPGASPASRLLEEDLAGSLRRREELTAAIARRRSAAPPVAPELESGRFAGAAGEPWRGVEEAAFDAFTGRNSRVWNSGSDFEGAIRAIESRLEQIALRAGGDVAAVRAGPDGLPALTAALMRELGIDGGPDSARQIESAIAAVLDGWKRAASADPPPGRLEQFLIIGDLQQEFCDRVSRALPPESLEDVKRRLLLGEEVHWYKGEVDVLDVSPEKAADRIARRWMELLALDDVHFAAVRPVAERYLSEFRRINDRFEPMHAYPFEDWRAAERETLVVQIEALRSLEKELPATGDFLSRLRAWHEVTEPRFPRESGSRGSEEDR